MKNTDKVNHFSNTGYARRTVYNTTTKIESATPIKDKKRTDRPTIWTTDRMKKTEETGPYNRKWVSKTRLSKKILLHSKISVTNYQKWVLIITNGKKHLNMMIYRRLKQKTMSFTN